MSSTLICYCSLLTLYGAEYAHIQILRQSGSPPLCLLLFRMLSILFCTPWTASWNFLSASSLNLIWGSKGWFQIQELQSNKPKCWINSWWLSVSPRQTSHGHLFDVSHEVVNESRKDRVSNQPSDKRNATKIEDSLMKPAESNPHLTRTKSNIEHQNELPRAKSR